MVVGGDEEVCHGIVLAKNLLAKKWGIPTAEALRDARRKCPELVVPGYLLHIKVSSLAECVYYDYSDRVEPFGPDEVWIDVSGTQRRLGLTPEEIACEISERMKAELGTTVSVGVSWSKIFAKFGSEHKKPDAVTVIDEYNYQYVVWRAQGRELLYVRTAIERKKHSSGICTIGDLLMRRITTCSTG